ncbi:MAG: hypothetical protein LBH43_08935 [Treponema sp.]|nr:hypothetical protein [Treponema sp.]
MTALIHLFLSKKSNSNIKMAALIALLLSGIAAGICGIIIFTASDNAENKELLEFSTVSEASPTPEKTNVSGLIIFLVALLVFFVFVIYLGFKDRKNKG